MGAKVSGFVKDVAKAAAKGATSFVLGKVPIIGTPLANKLNSLYAKGGKVIALADGGEVPAGMKPMVINTPKQLLDLVKKEPEIAKKSGLTPELVKEEIEKAKQGEVVAKARGGRMKKTKKAKEDRVMLESASAPAFARGGLVPSVF